jgi:hypothetical protein
MVLTLAGKYFCGLIVSGQSKTKYI